MPCPLCGQSSAHNNTTCDHCQCALEDDEGNTATASSDDKLGTGGEASAAMSGTYREEYSGHHPGFHPSKFEAKPSSGKAEAKPKPPMKVVGHGVVQSDCKRCFGGGYVTAASYANGSGGGATVQERTSCNACRGSGKLAIPTGACHLCGGYGVGLPCTTCGRTGVDRLHASSTKDAACGFCNGVGWQKCLCCYGEGWERKV